MELKPKYCNELESISCRFTFSISEAEIEVHLSSLNNIRFISNDNSLGSH